MPETVRGIALKWLKKAEHDVRHAVFSLEHDDFDWAQLACQQAAEKALKAVCISSGLGLARMHDLTALARKLGAPTEILEQCGLLNSFYTSSRYPDVEEFLDEQAQKRAAEDALAAAREVLKWCIAKL